MPKADLAQIALTQVGTWCYVWGGNGEDMTAMTDEEREAWIERRESEEENRERVRTLFSKLVEDGVELIRGGDCSGFVYWCMKELGVWKSDMNANYIYHNKVDVIDKLKLAPGDLAFRITDGKASHIGVYVGNGHFIHSKGRDVGVVDEESTASYWQSFGQIKDFKEEPEPEPTPTGTYVLFKGSVNIRYQPGIDYKVIYIAHKGEKLPYLASYIDASEREWYSVETKKGIGFCSAFTGKPKKYTELIEV